MPTFINPTPSSAPVVDDEHPWLGLDAYTEKTHAFFFGRDPEISEIFTRVRENSLTVLYGQSGLGKSSLLGAGLIPKLKIEGYRPVLIRLDFSKNAPPLVTQACGALCRSLAIDIPDDPSSLWEILHHLPSRPDTLKDHPPVLIFDQFEETFTQGGPRPDEVKQWFTQIADLVENRPPATLQKRFRNDRQLARQFDSAVSPARIVITLREDYLSHLERWKGMLPSLMRNRMALHLLSGPQALEVSVHPGRRRSRPIVSELVGAQIVRKVARRPDDVPLESIEAVPPFLSLLCEQLNAARFKTVPPLEQITTELVVTHSDDILDSYYEESFNGQPTTVRSFVEDKLVSLGGHRNSATREDAVSELRNAGVADPDQAIDALIAHRLLTAEERGGIPRLELTHDVLTPLVIRSRATRQEKEALLRARRQRRRQTEIITALVAVALVFAGLAVFGGISYYRAERENRKARMNLSQSDFLQGIEKIEKGNTNASLAYLASSIRNHPDTQNTSAASRIVHLFMQRSFALPLIEPMQHGDFVISAVFSPDGGRIVTASGDKTARVWDAATGKALIEPMQHGDAVRSAVFSPDGARIVTASWDKTARVWDAATGKALTEPMQHGDVVFSAVFSPDGARIVTASWDKTARVWDAATGKALTEPMHHGNFVRSAVFSPDGARIVTASDDKTARVWDAATGKALTEPMQHGSGVISAVFSPDGARIVTTASRDKTARVWDAATGKALTEPMQHGNEVISAVFSPDGARIVTASRDKTARVWDAATGKALIEPMQHGDFVISAVFSPDGGRIVTASGDKTARVWDAATGKALTEPMQHGSGVISAVFSPDGSRIVTASGDKTARVWDAATGKALTEPMQHGSGVISAVFSPDGGRIVTASRDKTARVWDAATGKALTEPMQHGSGVYSAVFSPDGARIVTASWDKTARVWDAATGKALTEPMHHGDAVRSAVFSPDGARIVTASDDKTAMVWDAATGKALTEPMQHGDFVISAVFSPDGGRIVTASRDTTARVWDAATGKALTDPMQHGVEVLSAVFSPDGARIVTASRDKTARVWDAATGKALTEPMQHGDFVFSAVFSPDGARIVTASWDKTARVWDAATGKALTEPMQHGDAVRSAVFSLDGIRIVTASDDTTARVWDAATGKALTDPMQHGVEVLSAVFSPDGASVVTASSDKTARVWPLAPSSEVPVPDWLASLAEAVAGYRVNDQRVLEPVPPDQILQFRERFRNAQDKDPYSQIARWFFAERTNRPASPYHMDAPHKGTIDMNMLDVKIKQNNK